MLEILLITYNRCSSLARTLSALRDSVARDVPITVLDNCSPDDTRNVIDGFKNEGILNLRYIRHGVNIGACANVLRAYELATARYVWLICDDDDYNFGEFEGVLNILKCNNPDVLVVGNPLIASPDQLFPERVGRLTSFRDFQDTKLSLSLTFLPSAIIKREMLLGCDFSVGYALSQSFFPQYFWISQCFNRNSSVYIFPLVIVSRPIIDHGLENDFVHINGYLRAVKLLERVEDVERAYISYVGEGYWSYFKTVAKIMLKARVIGRFRLLDWKEHVLLVDPTRVVVFVLASCALLIPVNAIRLLMVIFGLRLRKQ